jgi:tRNA(fMet)-specific endonuclease VapC
MVKRHHLLAAYQPHLVGYDLVVSFQTLAELAFGGVSAGWGHAKWAALNTVLTAVVVIHSDDDICDRWAEVRLVRQPQPIGVADAWIAATALAHNLELVTHNPADFGGIPGLTVITEAP